MKNFRESFGPFTDQVWLNCASEGPLPRVAVEALKQAIQWKINPDQLTNEKFSDVPRHLKSAIGKLISAPAEDIILGNSATYGIHLLANGIPWKKDDEIVVMLNDFPTDVLPWLALEERGVAVRQVRPQGVVLQPEELKRNITSKTRLVCMAQVHSFSGHFLDVKSMGEICREKGILFVVNVSQSLGYLPISISDWHVDALTTAGFKWLCGPYGTGFCWVKPELRATLKYNHSHWIAMLEAEDLAGDQPIRMREVSSARRYDVFGTANFFNFVPWTKSIEYLTGIGMKTIQKYNDTLVESIVAGLNEKKYRFISPLEPSRRSPLVVISHLEAQNNKKIFNLLKNEGLHTAFWQGNIRISPHLYNTQNDIGKLLGVLNAV